MKSTHFQEIGTVGHIWNIKTSTWEQKIFLNFGFVFIQKSLLKLTWNYHYSSEIKLQLTTSKRKEKRERDKWDRMKKETANWLCENEKHNIIVKTDALFKFSKEVYVMCIVTICNSHPLRVGSNISFPQYEEILKRQKC